MMCCSVSSTVVDALVEELHVVGTALEHGARKTCLQEGLGQIHVAARSQKAISGSTIQNSARWRLVLEFSARKVGPKV